MLLVLQLPLEIQWHFIGTLQSNKVKALASTYHTSKIFPGNPQSLTHHLAIPNLDTIHTLTSLKTAKALNKALPQDRKTPLKVLLQVNTSNEASKSGLAPLVRAAHMPETTTATTTATPDVVAESELAQLAKDIILECPRLRVQGLMTIGALEQSLGVSASEGEKNADFERLKETRDLLEAYLVTELGGGDGEQGKWGQENRLLLSMGMSSDFEAAIKAGSDIVRVGTGIFGERRTKQDID